MQKSVVFIIAAAFFSLLILVSAHSQEDMRHVDNSIFSNPQRESAVFNHEEHNETAGIEECNECHHVYDEDGNKLEYESSEDMQCAECHEENSSGPAPSLDKAFHVNCMGCHLEQKKGPILCGECHIKQ
jgi:hypothetical protein